MEPVEEYIDDMLRTAKILSRLFLDHHITSEELAMLQVQLMKPAPQPLQFHGSLVYNAPGIQIPSFMDGSGTVIINEDSASAAGYGVTSPYFVLK